MDVLLRKTDDSARVPAFAHEGDSGLDIYSLEDTELKPLERKLVRTGISIEMPHGVEAQVRPKSGLALEHGITLLNTPGTIDSSYRGEIKVLMINLGDKTYRVGKNKKIAQLVFARVEKPRIVEVGSLSDTTRKDGGFGSTGLD
ncbi:MAG: dUTP diphosphatase [archaeon]|nr:dUTP diphosphatase [archaeon]